MKKLLILLLIALMGAGCASRKGFVLKAGLYCYDHPQAGKVDDALNKSSACVYLSWHNNISLPPADENGEWENNMSVEQLGKRLKQIANRQQITILKAKNYSKQSQLEEKVMPVLKELGFRTIIVQQAHSRATIIEKVITPPNPEMTKKSK